MIEFACVLLADVQSDTRGEKGRGRTNVYCNKARAIGSCFTARRLARRMWVRPSAGSAWKSYFAVAVVCIVYVCSPSCAAACGR